MRIIHFIEIAHITTIKFIMDLARLVPGEHTVVNQDPLSSKAWFIPDTTIPVYQGLTLSEKMKKQTRPDVVLNYTSSNQLCQYEPTINISTKLPDEDRMSTCMVDVARIPKPTHHLDPIRCRVIDLSKEDYDLSTGHVAFYVAEAGEHEPRRIIEAMAAGIPVVVNRTWHTAQLVMNGINGLLVSPDENIDNCITTLTSDPDIRYELGLAAVHWVQQTADIQYIVDALRKLDADNRREID